VAVVSGVLLLSDGGPGQDGNCVVQCMTVHCRSLYTVIEYSAVKCSAAQYRQQKHACLDIRVYGV
jgi:hypothetical protein